VDDKAVVTLVLGGARSGKSEAAERMAAALAADAGGAVTYVATGVAAGDGPPVDEAWATRIAAHRARRPADWVTAEVPRDGSLSEVLGAAPGVVLLDSLGTFVSALPGFGADDAGRAEVAALLDALATRRAERRLTVVVSDEVGMGVVPATAAGNAFRDALGELNRQVAEQSDEVVLVVAGRLLQLTAPRER
jgi:adenosylcobinamide kinase / adenosylcobinamide-phosphate guanylyltransferase